MSLQLPDHHLDVICNCAFQSLLGVVVLLELSIGLVVRGVALISVSLLLLLPTSVVVFFARS